MENFKNFTKIVIVDDNEDEGNDLKNALDKDKIPSVFYHIQSYSDLPEEPYKNLRIIFLDLLFSSSSGLSPRVAASTALSYLSKFISENSFYTLVIWSSNTTSTIYTEFNSQLERAPNICKPIKIFTINKSIRHDLDLISAEIKNIFNDIPLIEIFKQWEYMVENSRSSSLHSLIKHSSDNDDLSKLLNSLASASSGTSIRKKNIPKQALGILNSILDDNISKELEEKKFGSITRKINNSSLSTLNKSKLNHNLIFDPNVSLKGTGSMYEKRNLEKKEKIIKSIISQKSSILGNIIDKIKLFYIDVTPLCDSANNKGHTYFIDALLHPKIFVTVQGKRRDIKAEKGNGYMLDKYFNIDGEEYGLTINIKSYCTDKTLIKYCSSKRKLRSNIIIDIQHKLGEHLSRPGHRLL